MARNTDRADDALPVPTSAKTSSSLVAVAVGGTADTFLPQDHLYRAAVTFGTGVTNTNGAFSTAYLGSRVNSTLTLPSNGTEIAAFRGISNKLTTGGKKASIVALVIYLVAGYI